MAERASIPPYFELLLDRLERGDPATSAAFGRHVHWGYWSDPSGAQFTPADYASAAERLCLEVLEQAGVRNHLCILDVGCGFGGTIACLNERLNGAQLVGVNIDARQLQRAAAQVQAENGNKIEFHQADAAQLPFADRSFDIVLAVECAFHFDRGRFFAEASRVLRSGGNLTLSDFVPEERAAEYIGAFNMASDDALRWTFGKVDFNWPLSRYRDLGASHSLKLSSTTDITSHTLPTYEFLKQSADGSMSPGDAEKFLRATILMEKASRRGWLAYQMLRFDKD